MKTYSKIASCLAALGLAAVSSHAQVTTLGSFQGASDPLNAGWINPATGNPISTDPADSFPAAGVPGYAQSLQVTGTAGSFGSDSVELQFSPAQIAAFNANSWITFTFSVPSYATTGSTSGYSQIYNLVLNAPTYGYNNQNWNNALYSGQTAFDTAGSGPNFYFFTGSPAGTQEVTMNYSSVLAAIEAGGEGYLQMTLQGNQGGGAPDYIYLNNVVLSPNIYGTPEPSTLALLALGGVAGGVKLFRRRKVA